MILIVCVMLLLVWALYVCSFEHVYACDCIAYELHIMTLCDPCHHENITWNPQAGPHLVLKCRMSMYIVAKCVPHVLHVECHMYCMKKDT